MTTILSPKYWLPPATSELILLAIEPKTTSAQIPIVMPEIVSTVRSFRRHRFATVSWSLREWFVSEVIACDAVDRPRGGDVASSVLEPISGSSSGRSLAGDR